MKLLILISAIAVVNAKPQGPTRPTDDQTVQIEKQEVREIKLPQPRTLLGSSQDAQRSQSTKEIIDKIVEVNRKHGLTPKGLKTNQDYIQVPTLQRSGTAKQQNFQFSQNPFSNPIFDYLNGNPDDGKTRQNVARPTKFSAINTNAEINPDDNIPGQFIKRKITHHQTFIIPTAGGMMGNYDPINFAQMQNMYYQNQPLPQQIMHQTPLQTLQLNPLQPPVQDFPQTGVPNSSNSSQPENLKKTLENQTVENIKNIVNTQLPPQMVFNPYAYARNPIQPYFPAYSFYGYPNNREGFSETQPLSSNSYRMNGPNAKIPNDIMLQQLSRPGRQWQWPLAQYFPIVIKDPLQQIFNAFTSMVEYGQQSNALCADEQKMIPDITGNEINRSAKNLKNLQAEQSTDSLQEVSKPMAMDIENLEVTEDATNPLKLTVRFEPDTERTEKKFKSEEPLRVNAKIAQFSQEDSRAQQSESETLKRLINFKDKNKNDSNKIRLFSRDNTGNGVFIQKLRVTKGGVAIAGPGGIATAGSGGTAIVGPNGYAYTQPDSLAIAGSGTKVIAVDPGVNLSELIESVKMDKTGTVHPRVGKIVAIGPTVYYNKG